MNQKAFIIVAIIGIASLTLFSSYRKKMDDFFPQQTEQGSKNDSPAASLEKSNDHKIQVVFALDATGSMSGLINAAKEKIWGIASSMTQAEEAPKIEIGLLFYRDRGDDFVTQVVPLSENLDDVYEKLMKINAAGGGDTPESVNQALYESITKFQWDANNENTYKSVFLVGDCPPHMDYQDDVKYPISCSKAKEADIFLNTILMGNDKQAEGVWRKIANFNQGSFTKVDMNVNDIAMPTPYDEEIAQLSDKVDDMRYYYGTESEKSLAVEKKNKSVLISKNAAPMAKVQRAEYNTTKSGKSAYIGKKELLNDLKENKLDLATISESELPAEFKNIAPSERKKAIELKATEKQVVEKKLTELISKRKEYVDIELAKKGNHEVDSSFSNVIYDKIKSQSNKKNIKLNGKAKF